MLNTKVLADLRIEQDQQLDTADLASACGFPQGGKEMCHHDTSIPQAKICHAVRTQVPALADRRSSRLGEQE
jgi:hypothetical protein